MRGVAIEPRVPGHPDERVAHEQLGAQLRGFVAGDPMSRSTRPSRSSSGRSSPSATNARLTRGARARSRPDVTALLTELFADAERVDAPMGEALRALSATERTALFTDYRRLYGDLAKDAYLPISPAGGALLYTLARVRDAATIVEFGTSFGLSTIYLAAALVDRGGGRLITSELSPAKAARARANLERAGLAHVVEFRVGDALDTLADLPAGVELLYLDGAKSLYRSVLGLVEPRFAPRAVIAADNIDLTPLVHEFTSYVRDPANGYASNRVVIGDEPLEVCVRTAGA